MAETVSSDLRINADRLQRSLRELAEIGAYQDDATGLTGVRRVALTDEDAAGRVQVVEWFEDAGLDVTVDRVGNVYGRRPGRDDSLAPVMAGSHIDTVPSGGAYDGALGVLGALEVVRSLNDRQLATRRPIIIGFFTDEEGIRFGTDMLGSAVATGRLALEEAYEATDRDGLTVRDELQRTGFLGAADVHAWEPHAYVECHIEQGPVLRSKGLDLGVVTGVQGISWQEFTLLGRACHAGTTPLEYRRDPSLAAAHLRLRLQEMATSGDYGPGMRATMGSLRTIPGATNVVPSRIILTVDLRNPDDAELERAERDLQSFCAELSEREQLEIESRRLARTPAVAFDETVQDIIARHATAHGLTHERILSGAGHDAQEWSRIAKTAMIFVPGEHDGISHNPREYSTPEQCSNGVNVLFHTMLSLAEEE